MNAIDPTTQATAPVATPGNDTPAVETPEPVVSKDSVKAERYAAANQALEQAHTDAVAKAAAEVTAAKEAEAAKAKEADTVGNLSKELAEAKAKADLLSTKADRAAVLDNVEALVKAGKHYDAIQALQGIGLSFDNAVQQVMNPGQEPVPAPVKDEDKPVDPTVKALQDQVKVLTDRVKQADEIAAAAAKEAGRKSVVEHVKAQAKDFPYLASNEEWVTKALADAEPDYAKAIEANRGQDISEEAKNDLVIKALAKAEAEHKATATKYMAVTGKPQAGKSPNDVPKMTQPTLTITNQRAGLTPAVKTGKAASLEELKRARRQSAN